MHLLLPLLASLLLVCGLILIKRAGEAGCGPVAPLFLTNIFSALAFSALWILGGNMQPASMLWQPATIALLFICGLVFTFLAIERGDVSIATPVLGVKVIIVAVILTFFIGSSLPRSVWFAAVMATTGIGVIQWTGQADARRAVFTIVFALLAATSFATFDVLVQQWAPAWGPGRFLPVTYWMVGALSLPMLPWVDFKAMRRPSVRGPLLAGATLTALQAICIVSTIAAFGDAARVNVVYALRGLWGVVLAWIVAKKWGGPEAMLSRNLMVTRAVGAALLTGAVILAITAK